MFAHTKFNMLCTSSLVVQFSKINAVLSFPSLSGVLPCHAVPFLCDSLFIIPLSFPFVKRFFKSFLSFFEVLSEALTSVLDATYILYHILSRLSSGFRKILEILFSTLSRTLYCFALAHSFNIIPHPAPDVNPFFDFFLDSSYLLHIPAICDVWMYKCNRFW